MTDKRTPGPWVKDKYGTLRGSNGKPVVVRATGIGNACTWSDDEVEANSRLVESAAEMYEALRDARHILCALTFNVGYIDDVLNRAGDKS